MDAVVADAALAGIGGGQFLEEVMKRHPSALRFIRSEFSAHRLALRCVGTAHQFWLKPGDAQTARRALEQAFALEAWLPSDGAQRLMAALSKLPSPPELYFRVVKALQNPDVSMEEIGSLVGEDAAMTAKLLQLANSAIFGLQLEVSNPSEAIVYLGMEMTKSLILLAHTYSYFDGLSPSEFSVDTLRKHSLAVGYYARDIVQMESEDREMAGLSFTAGLLHDVGKMLLAANLPKDFRGALKLARREKTCLWEAETKVFGANHAEIGACLLAIWGLPVPMVEAVALHHHPTQLVSKSFSALTAVHVANSLEHQAQNAGNEAVPSVIDEDYLDMLRLKPRLDSWKQLCSQPAT
jgi:putative nucleotidyltransferase with HDIG domain